MPGPDGCDDHVHQQKIVALSSGVRICEHASRLHVLMELRNLSGPRRGASW